MCTCILKFLFQVHIAKIVYLQVHNFGYVYFYLQVQIAFTISKFQNFKIQKGEAIHTCYEYT